MGVRLRTTAGLTDLYVLFKNHGTAVAATEDAGLDAGWYEALDADILTAALPAGVYDGAFLRGTVGSPDAADPEEGIFSEFAWSGTASVDRVDEIIDGIDDITSGAIVIPVNQVPVPLSRTWILKHRNGELVGELPLERSVGTELLFAVDYRNDLATNGRLTSLDSVVLASGTAGGITFPADDQGVDRSQAKFKIVAVTPGTYTIDLVVSYDDSDGGGTSPSTVTLIVT